MIKVDDHYEHPNCTRAVNPKYLEQTRKAEQMRAFEAGEIKCQFCEQLPATDIVQNKSNGKKYAICKSCLTSASENKVKESEVETACQ